MEFSSFLILWKDFELLNSKIALLSSELNVKTQKALTDSFKRRFELDKMAERSNIGIIIASNFLSTYRKQCTWKRIEWLMMTNFARKHEKFHQILALRIFTVEIHQNNVKTLKNNWNLAKLTAPELRKPYSWTYTYCKV